MNLEKNNEVSSYLENISLLLLGISFIALPLVFTTITSDPFVLPKQILLAAVVLIGIFLFGAKMISDGKVIFRRTPFDLPVLIFGIFTLVSSLLAVNRYESLIAYAPFLFAILLYFLIINLTKMRASSFFLVSCLVLGACILSLLSLLSLLKIYVLPFDFTHVQNFTPIGSLLDQAVYLALILPVAGYFVIPLLKADGVKKVEEKTVVYIIATVIITVGLLATVYQLLSTQKLLILPFETGFQTAFAAISQDAGRVAQGFFFGSGFGTYATDFTRFKQATFNLNQNLWSLTFFRSSSFILELLATTGVLGIAAFIFLIIKIIKSKTNKTFEENEVYLALLLAAVAAFILPFTFITQALFFLLIGIFTAIQGLKNSHKYYDVELSFIAFKHGIIPFMTSPAGLEEIQTREMTSYQAKPEPTKVLPVSFFVLIVLFTGVLGFYVIRYIYSDVTFQNSLIAAASNNGLQTYNDQVNAIKIFPYRDTYHRIYAQTNIALANSLAAQRASGTTPSAEVQQTIYTLIQQSINSGRTATAISPLTSANWQNLSSVYRSLIGFGKDAESFALYTNQQGIVLDPNNPQLYLNLGGIYYQLGQWENAQRQFQIAINLKPDYPNAYYNLGHALENKGDLKGALDQYQTVKTLIANDQANSKKITAEIDALQKKIEGTGTTPSLQSSNPAENQPGLDINKPSTQLPERKPQVQIPAPSVVTPTPTITPKPTGTVTPTVQPTLPTTTTTP